MDRILIFLIILLCSISLFTCDNDKNIPKKQNLNSVSKTNETSKQVDSIEKSISVQTNKIEKLLKPETLEKFLPQNFAGFNKLPASFGSVYEDDYSFTSASSDYVHPNKFSGFTIYIEDYGNEESIKFRNNIDNPQIEPGYTFKRISGPNYRGLVTMSKSIKTGTLIVIVANRFIVKIVAEKLTKESPELEDILNSINLNELINKAKQNIQ